MKRALLLWMAALAVAACVRTGERPECSPAALLAIEDAYIRDVLQHCVGASLDDCGHLPAIEARYAALREEWIRCR